MRPCSTSTTEPARGSVRSRMAKRSPGFGHGRERAVRKLLEADGWFVIRAPGSLGFADLVALKAGETPRLIEVKGTAAGPYDGFGPSDRAALAEAAIRAGAIAELAYWPANKELRWIRPSEWP